MNRILKRRDGITLPSKKVCPGCRQEKKSKDFNKRTAASGNTVLNSYCKPCDLKRKKEWRIFKGGKK